MRALLLLVIVITLGACSKPHPPSLSLWTGQGEYKNKVQSKRTEVRASVPVIALASPALVLSAIAQGNYSAAKGEPSMTFKELLAGLSVGNASWLLSVSGDHKNYRIKGEGFGPWRNNFRVKAGVTHSNTYRDLRPQDRIKSMQVYIGAEYKIKGASVGLEYSTGNHQSDFVSDHFIIGVKVGG